MTEPQRVVIDTSTLVGAVLRPASVPRQAFMAVVGSCELCMSPATLQELHRVLGRAKFDRYAPRQQRMDFADLVARHSRLWEIDTASEQAAAGACRDSKDDKFLALALACGAVTLVSSDDDLLVLHPWQGIQVLAPAVFLQRES